MKKYQGYLIDLDGTMYNGTESIEGAAAFVHTLSERNNPYLFLTNNSTSTQRDVARKLIELDIHATADHIFTSSMATAKYIKNKNPQARCMVIGEKGLQVAFEKEGLLITDHTCDYVVIGLDREITYEKLAKAALAIRSGATFISTNGDIAIPTERGFLPGNGALTSVLTISTGQQPIFIGKPENEIMQGALDVLNVPRENVLMVGDNYQTDIQAGIQANIDTLMVFTGITPYEEYSTLPKKPTYHVQNLFEWIKYM